MQGDDASKSDVDTIRRFRANGNSRYRFCLENGMDYGVEIVIELAFGAQFSPM